MKKLFATFIGLLVLSKIGYLLCEMYYNGLMLDTVTSVKVLKEDFESIETLGHNLTSFGVTLLFAPLFYFLVKKMTFKGASFLRPTVFFALSTLLYSQVYFGLQTLMDKVVASQQDKRYESYYVNGLKYGIIGGAMGYGTFIPKRSDGNFSIVEKVLLSNIFLLTHIDKTLIDRLIKEGSESMIDVFIEKYGDNEYARLYNEFSKAVEDSNRAWSGYQGAQNNINKEIQKRGSVAALTESYEEMQKEITNAFNNYKSGVDAYHKKLNEGLSRKNEIHNRLKEYFKYAGNAKAEKKYQESMQKEFGHFIPPSSWCKSSVCPSEEAIVETIKKEVLAIFQSKSNGAPVGLESREAFVGHPAVKKNILHTLRAKGLAVKDSFDYSGEQFKEAYEQGLASAKNNHVKKLQDELKEKLGVHVPLGLDKKSFMGLFATKVSELVQDPSSRDKILHLMVQNDKESFYEDVYRPYFKKHFASRYFLTEEDFKKPENEKIGDIAIKMLYVPPFAVTMSLVAGGLNLVTVVALLLTGWIRKPKFRWIAKGIVSIGFIGLIVYLPYKKALDENILSSHVAINSGLEAPWGTYVTVLNWVIIAERFNYEIIYPALKPFGTLFGAIKSDSTLAIQKYQETKNASK